MNDVYIGFRIEIPNRFIIKNFVKKFNSKNIEIQIFDFYKNGKIVAKKKDNLLMVSGEKTKRNTTFMANFALVIKIKDKNELERIIQIINVLGNGRLIREKVSIFINKKSMLNNLPQLQPLEKAFKFIEKIMPGFSKAGWFYAPEAIY